jgi:hypothetical protein
MTPAAAVKRYRLCETLHPDRGTLECTATLAVRNVSRHNIRTVPLLLNRRLAVRQARDDTGLVLPFAQSIQRVSGIGRRLRVNAVTLRLLRQLCPGSSARLTVSCAGTIAPYAEVWPYVHDRIAADYSLLRPDAFAYPVLSRPRWSDCREAWGRQFNYSIELTVPTGYTAACGGREYAKRTVRGAALFCFKSAAPTWRIDAAVARFRVARDTDSGIRVYALPRDAAAAKRIITEARQARSFFTRQFGPAGGDGGYAIIEIPSGWGSQAGDGYCLQEAGAFRNPRSIDELYHEIAHRWNARATQQIQQCRWFDEAFASYFAGLAIEEFRGQQAFGRYMESLRRRFVQRARDDRRNASVPIAQYGTHGLGSNCYTKGAWALHVLRESTGPAAFTGIIRELLVKHRNRPADFHDFQRICLRRSTAAIMPFFDEWLFGNASSRLLIDGLSVQRMADRYRQRAPLANR